MVKARDREQQLDQTAFWTELPWTNPPGADTQVLQSRICGKGMGLFDFVSSTSETSDDHGRQPKPIVLLDNSATNHTKICDVRLVVNN